MEKLHRGEGRAAQQADSERATRAAASVVAAGKQSAAALASAHDEDLAAVTVLSLQQSVAGAQRPLALLLAAVARGDVNESTRFAIHVRVASHALDDQLARMPAGLREQWAAHLTTLRNLLAGALARAPRISTAAKNEGRQGNWQRKDRELATWAEEARSSPALQLATSRSVAAVRDVDRAKVEVWLAQNVEARVTGEITHDTVHLVLSAESEHDRAALRQALRLVTPTGDLEMRSLGHYLRVARFELARAKAEGHAGVLDPLATTSARASAATADKERVPGRITQSAGLVVSGNATTFEIVLDLPREHEARVRALARLGGAPRVEWVFQRVDATHAPERATAGLTWARALRLTENETRGVWRVDAFVAATDYAPTHLTTLVEVKTSAERMRDVTQQALGEAVLPAGTKHAFDNSWGDKLAFDQSNTTGTRVEGRGVFAPSSFSQRTERRIAETAQLGAVLAHFEKEPEKYEQAIAALKHSIARSRDDNARLLVDVAQGWHQFDVRTAYVSTTDGVTSGPLEIWGQVRRTRVGHGSIHAEVVHVRLRDFSRLVTHELTTYTGTGGTFEEALQDAYESLSRDYPPGRLAIFAQAYDPTGRAPTGEQIGFERPTSSHFNERKKKFFTQTVGVAVAVGTAFLALTPLAPIVIPLSLAFGIGSSLDSASDHITRGTMTGRRALVSALDIATALLPLGSQAKAVTATTFRHVGYHVIEKGTELLLVADQTRETFRALQAQDVAVVADLYEQLRQLEASTHPSDPRLVEIREQVEFRAQGMRTNIVKAIWEAAASQAIQIVPSKLTAQLTHMAKSALRGAAPPSSTHADAAEDPTPLRDHAEPLLHPVVAPAPFDVAVTRPASLGTRSHNTGKVTPDATRAAIDELVASSMVLRGARHEDGVITLTLDDGRAWTIRVDRPQPTDAGHMAGLAHEANGDRVWVSDSLTNEQVTRALGAVIGQSLARATKNTHAVAGYAELDAMFARRAAVANTPAPSRSLELRPHALAASRVESVARIDAEIDLQLTQLGLTGPASAATLARLPAELADRIRQRLEGGVFAFRSASVIADLAVMRPRAMPTTALATSKVIPDAPTEVRAYGEVDHIAVLELRVELETIKEIDARVSLRDQAGTFNMPELATGETRRRIKHVENARALMAKLQLGGGDGAYLELRLRELAAVFPGTTLDVVPAVRERIARRTRAERAHTAALAYRDALKAKREEIIAALLAREHFTTGRVMVGGGMSAVANLATLDVAKAGDWVAANEMLVLANDDLIARMEAHHQWGQRAAVYDRADRAHPAFSDGDGIGNGQLVDSVEDPGEFMHMGELRDALDLARQRLGMATVPSTVTRVETTRERDAAGAPWAVDEKLFPVRITVTVEGQVRHVYTRKADLVTGPGKPNMPHESVLSATDRAKLLGDNKLIAGDRLLGGFDVRGKRVLVIGIGPVGAWAAHAAYSAGASGVDIAGASRGDVAAALASNRKEHQVIAGIDRLQDVLDGSTPIRETMDAIVGIVPQGKGALVTFSDGTKTYRVKYDLLVASIAFSAHNKFDVPGAEPTLKDMIGEMQLVPHRHSETPVLQDIDGLVRVMGFTTHERINVDGAGGDRSDWSRFGRRAPAVEERSSADSPDYRVLEGSGQSIRAANRKERK